MPLSYDISREVAGFPGGNGLALDKSIRRFDGNGNLHVELTPISKGNICEYYGAEIPDAEALGLDPKRKYSLFRDPAELKKAAASFNNIPLLSRHVPVSAEEPQQDLVVGSTGTDAKFDAPFLMNSLVVWVAGAISLIESDSKKQLSSAYRYRADMTPGSYEGVRYDGVMRDIHGNHVALVEEGRAGADVVIGDSLPPGLRVIDPSGVFEPMPTIAPATSRKAQFVQGALAVYLRSKLAQDANIDLKKALLGTTRQNWPTAKPMIAARIKTLAAGKLAQDASLEDMHGLLDSLDREGEDDEIDGMDESEEEKEARLKKEAEEKAADDEEAETEEEKAARMKKRAEDKAAKDAEMPEAMKAKMEAEKAAKDAEPKPITKEAMDAAISAAVIATQLTQQQIREAEREVFPWVGAVLPQKTPEDVYRLALDSLPTKPNLTGVHPSAYKAILAAYPKPGSRQAATHVAMDAAGASDFDKRFPDVSRILNA